MKLPRETLVFHALCVLDDACVAAGRGKLTLPQPGVRLALAFLYAVSNADREWQATDRAVFDELWLLLTGDRPMMGSRPDTMRSTEAHGCLQQIARRVGTPISIELTQAFARVNGRETPAGAAWSRSRSTVRRD